MSEDIYSLYSFAVCDEFEDPAERRALNELREALGLDAHICSKLEACAQDLFSVYGAIEEALTAEPSPIVVEK